MRCIMTVHNGDGVVIAVDEAGKLIRIDWQSELEVEDNHHNAVRALYKQQGWVFTRPPFKQEPKQQSLVRCKGISTALTVDFDSVQYTDTSSKTLGEGDD